MGKMQDNLEPILASGGLAISHKHVPYVKLDDIQQSTYSNQVQNTYENLGGK